MDRHYYLNLAHQGLAMPIGADLILHEKANPAEILHDGEQLGSILEETAQRFHTPLAVPHMDLELEKQVLLRMLGIAEAEIDKYHFSVAPDNEMAARLQQHLHADLPSKFQAHIDSVRYIAEQTDLVPIGMSIGPFSLMTKLIADPITPICLAGSGFTSEEEEEILLIEETLQLAVTFILSSIKRQIDAGAKAIFIAEPAANKVYLSPNQIDEGSDIFDRFVMVYNHQIKALCTAHDVDLIFHCCGELTPYMVQKFCELDPAILSLGSSRKLWEDAALVPKQIVLYGNLPSKKFYSDALYTVDDVMADGCALLQRMHKVNHPFILGTECDVLSVPNCEATILAKATAILYCGDLCLT